jgi:glycine oxidase
VVGRCGPDGLVLASGHYRNGILMSPVTADAVTAILAREPAVPEWAPFTPERFTGQRFTGQGQ